MPVVLKAVHFMGFIRFDTTAVNQAFVFEFHKIQLREPLLSSSHTKEISSLTEGYNLIPDIPVPFV